MSDFFKVGIGIFAFGLASPHLARALFTFALVDLHLACAFFNVGQDISDFRCGWRAITPFA